MTKTGGGRPETAAAGEDERGAAHPLQLGRRRFVSWLGWAWLAIPLSGLVAAACGSENGGEERASAGGSAGSGADREASARKAEAPSSGKTSSAAPNPKQTGEAVGAEPDENALVTEVPAMASLVKSVNYAHESPKPDQSCANCQLFTATANGLGDCKLFAQGLVEAKGWCTSWIKRANA